MQQQDWRRGRQMRRRLARLVHQIDQAVNRRDLGLLDDIRIARKRPQHGNIVGHHDLQAIAGDGQSRHQMRRQVQGNAIGQWHVIARPYCRRDQDDAGQHRRRGLGKRGHDHRSAHALPQRKERQAGIMRPCGGDKIAKIIAQRIITGPGARVGAAPEPALIIGQSGDALPRPFLARRIKSVGIVVHAVQGDDDGARAGGRLPPAERQTDAIARATKTSPAICGETVSVPRGDGSPAQPARNSAIAGASQVLKLMPQRSLNCEDRSTDVDDVC